MSTVRVRILDGALDRLTGDFAGELVDRCLDAGVDSAQRLVPIDTGDLQDTISVRQPATRTAGGVVGSYGAGGGEVDYELHVEFGTSTGPSQPYLRPSVDAVIAEARR